MSNKDKGERLKDWREKCCGQCKHHFIEYEGKKYPCSISLSTDDEVLESMTGNYGCLGIREYIETGVFPDRARKVQN